MAGSRRRMNLFAGLGGEDRDRGDGKLSQGLASLLLVVFLACLALFAMSQLKTVPDLVGMPAEEAKQTIEAAGFTVGDETTRAGTEAQDGEVAAQAPMAGVRVLAGSAVSLTVAEAGLTTAVEEEASSAGGGSSVEGIELPEWNGNPPREETIVPYDSDGLPSGTRVPSVMGMSQSAALSSLSAAGLSGSVRTARSTTSVPAGTVVAQKPGAESYVPAGSSVIVYISSGPPLGGAPYAQAPYN